MEFLYKPLSQIVLYISFALSVWGFYIHNRIGKVKVGLPSTILLDIKKIKNSIIFNINLSIFNTGTRFKTIQKIQIELHEYQFSNNDKIKTASYSIQASGLIIDNQYTLTPDINKLRHSTNFILPPQTPLSIWIPGRFWNFTGGSLTYLEKLKDKRNYEIEISIIIEKNGILKEKHITLFSNFQYFKDYTTISKDVDFIPIPLTEGCLDKLMF